VTVRPHRLDRDDILRVALCAFLIMYSLRMILSEKSATHGSRPRASFSGHVFFAHDLVRKVCNPRIGSEGKLFGIMSVSRASGGRTAGDEQMGKLRSMVVFAAALAAAGLLAARPALALTFEDISGKWCGSVSSYTFSPGTLVVVLYSENQPHRYKIENYAYDDDVITVNWVRDDEKLYTKFSEFSSDNRTMVQLQNEAGPRREFKRCS
jgi:hypothetical protein